MNAILNNTKPVDRLISIFIDLLMILLLFVIASSCYIIIDIFEHALRSTNHFWGGLANLFLFGLPILLSLILILVLIIKLSLTFVLLIVDISIKLISYKRKKNTEDFKNAKAYLNNIFFNDKNKDCKIKRWLFTHHMQGSLCLFNEHSHTYDTHYNKSYLERFHYYKIVNYFTDDDDRLGGLLGFVVVHVCLILLHCFFVNNTIHQSVFNSITIINFVLALFSALFIYLIFITINKIIENSIDLVYDKDYEIRRKYPFAYSYLYFNETTYRRAKESEIQALDYICKNKGVIVNNPGRRSIFGRDEAPMKLEEFKQSRYYKDFKKDHPNADKIDTNEIIADTDNKRYKHKYIMKILSFSIVSLFLLALTFFSLAAPYRLFQINYNQLMKEARLNYNKALGLYNKDIISINNKPDSVEVKVKSHIIDYNSVGNEWDTDYHIDNSDLDDNNTFEFKEKKLKITTEITELDDAKDDYSKDVFYIELNKDDFLKNDSSLCWTTTQTVHENGKRSNKRYAKWETTYYFTLKPKILPPKPKMYIENINVDNNNLSEDFFSNPLPDASLYNLTNDIIYLFK